tara:strand:- start:1431 stop:1784 length:354 start_codon:yes stop_codon:yes gene_type:complete
MKKVEVINYVKHIHYSLKEDLHVALAERDQADMAFTELQNNTKSFEEVCSHGLEISKENEKLRKENEKLKEEYYQLDLINQNLENHTGQKKWVADLENKLGEKCELISQMKQLLSLS